MTTVHIAAPGPSLTYDWIEPDQTIICINLALLKAPRADYWCCIDKPRDLHKMCFESAVRTGCTLLTKWKRVSHYKAKVPSMEVVNVYKNVGDSWVFKLNMHGSSWSIFAATAYATHNLGATTLVYHGVDMAGVGYFDELDPQKGAKDDDKNAKHWKNRWDTKELWPMHGLWLAARQNGVKLLGLPDRVKTTPKGYPGRKK